MTPKNVAVAFVVIAVLVACGLSTAGNTGNTGTGTVRVRQTTYCPTAEQWADWRWESDAHSLRCSWQIEPPNFLEADPAY